MYFKFSLSKFPIYLLTTQTKSQNLIPKKFKTKYPTKIQIIYLTIPNKFDYLTRGVAAVKFLVGQKKIIKKGSILFPIWEKNNFELGKKIYLVGQTPKLIHSRYAPVFNLLFHNVAPVALFFTMWHRWHIDLKYS